MILIKDFEFNLYGVYNYNKPGKLDKLVKFIRNNHRIMDGDIIEAGVYQGSTTFSIAMLLKEVGSIKKVYAFDSFSGFPPIYHENDDPDKFHDLFNRGVISEEHYNDYKKHALYKQKLSIDLELKNKVLHPKYISSSGDFSNNSLPMLEKKAKILGLDNIVFCKGNFDHTMNAGNQKILQKKGGVMAAIIDCDLYESYRVSLNLLKRCLNPGGLVYLDEYYSLKFPGAIIAVNEFLKKNDTFFLEKSSPVESEFDRWYLSCR